MSQNQKPHIRTGCIILCLALLLSSIIGAKLNTVYAKPIMVADDMTEKTTVSSTKTTKKAENTSTTKKQTTTAATKKAAYVSAPMNYTWDGPKLTKRAGSVQGPSGKETFYNLRMTGVIRIMRNLGYSEEKWPYWVRDDGCKMLGKYIMVAANLDLRPRETKVKTSLGWGIVCDTGSFARNNRRQLDLAVNWVIRRR